MRVSSSTALKSRSLGQPAVDPPRFLFLVTDIVMGQRDAGTKPMDAAFSLLGDGSAGESTRSKTVSSSQEKSTIPE